MGEEAPVAPCPTGLSAAAARGDRPEFSFALKSDFAHRFDALWSAPIRGPARQEKTRAMRAETEKLVDEIRQAIGLLRRHL
jgi:hypothetical protein